MILHDRIWGIFDSLGGRATVDEIFVALRNNLSPEEAEDLLDVHLRTAIRNAVRHADKGGLPLAASIGGTYIQRALWDEHEYRHVVRKSVGRSVENRGRARQYVGECLEVLGVDISDELAEAS